MRACARAHARHPSLPVPVLIRTRIFSLALAPQEHMTLGRVRQHVPGFNLRQDWRQVSLKPISSLCFPTFGPAWIGCQVGVCLHHRERRRGCSDDCTDQEWKRSQVEKYRYVTRNGHRGDDMAGGEDMRVAEEGARQDLQEWRLVGPGMFEKKSDNVRLFLQDSGNPGGWVFARAHTMTRPCGLAWPRVCVRACVRACVPRGWAHSESSLQQKPDRRSLHGTPRAKQ